MNLNCAIVVVLLAGTCAFGQAGAPGKAAEQPQGYAVAAMVGQVSGRPIYASKVFEPIREQLMTRGKQVPRAKFREEATDIIRKRVDGLVIEGLILAEAERNLSEQERYGLLQMLKLERERLIRLFGQGAPALADARIREKTGRSLDEKVNDYRQEVVVSKYMREKLTPQINVTRKDINRYYTSHYDEYNPPPGRIIHMIYTGDAGNADKIDLLLKEGKPFLEVAADAKLNSNRPENEGLFAQPIQGDGQLIPLLNAPMLKLGEGEYTDRIVVGKRFYWIYLKTISTGKARPLREVQGQIENKLRNLQFNQLSYKFHDDLLRNGSYDSKESMVQTLVDIAVVKFALPQ